MCSHNLDTNKLKSRERIALQKKDGVCPFPSRLLSRRLAEKRVFIHQKKNWNYMAISIPRLYFTWSDIPTRYFSLLESKLCKLIFSENIQLYPLLCGLSFIRGLSLKNCVVSISPFKTEIIFHCNYNSSEQNFCYFWNF